MLSAGAALATPVAGSPSPAVSPSPPAFAMVKRGDAGYEDARRDFNHRIDVRPAAIAYCASAEDVARTIAWANREKLPLAIRGGIGHDYEGFSLIEGGVVVDVSRMRTIEIDPSRNVARIGAGASLADIYATLAASGYTLPGGTCGTVGVSGLVTGGGFGILSRTHGLLCDRLVALELTGADAETRNSRNDAHGNDLLWSARGGGGGNFGVATSFEFALVPIPKTVELFALEWTWTPQSARKALAAWLAWGPGAPREIFSTFGLTASSSGSFYVGGISLGSRARLASALSVAFGDAVPDSQTITTMTYPQAQEHYAASGDPSNSFKGKSNFAVAPLPARAIDIIVDALANESGPSDSVQFDSLGGRISDIVYSATAFVHRDARYSIQYLTFWNGRNDGAAHLDWIRKLYGGVAPYVPAASYRNYCDLDLKDWSSRYYGVNYERLRTIKRRLDPEQRFRYAQSIVPA